jgi:hypothetical protein
MSLSTRQLLKDYRRAAAMRAAAVPASGGVRDEPVQHAEPLRGGIARIVAAYPDGTYHITELWYDGQAEEWIDAADPLGLTQADAVDYTGSLCGVVGQVVRFWEHRALGGQVIRVIDVMGGWGGAFKVSTFAVHYSGTNHTGAFHSVPNCLSSMVEIGLDARRCSSDTLATQHPATVQMAPTGGSVELGWCNALATWSGGDWFNLQYTAHNAFGSVEGTGPDAIYGFRIQCRVTGGGDLEFRIYNELHDLVSAVIVGAIRVTVCPLPPGTMELGNYCCHDNDWGTV